VIVGSEGSGGGLACLVVGTVFQADDTQGEPTSRPDAGTPHPGRASGIGQRHLPGRDRGRRPGQPGGAQRRPTGALRWDQMALAANSAQHTRRETRVLSRPPFTLEVTVTGAGQLGVGVSAAFRAERLAWLGRAYGLMVVTVRLRGPGADERYRLPLSFTDGRLTGDLELLAPPGRFTGADLDGPPIGAWEVEALDPEEGPPIHPGLGLHQRTARPAEAGRRTRGPPSAGRRYGGDLMTRPQHDEEIYHHLMALLHPQGATVLTDKVVVDELRGPHQWVALVEAAFLGGLHCAVGHGPGWRLGHVQEQRVSPNHDIEALFGQES
jgi:hypothetical protein